MAFKKSIIKKSTATETEVEEKEKNMAKKTVKKPEPKAKVKTKVEEEIDDFEEEIEDEDINLEDEDIYEPDEDNENEDDSEIDDSDEDSDEDSDDDDSDDNDDDEDSEIDDSDEDSDDDNDDDEDSEIDDSDEDDSEEDKKTTKTKNTKTKNSKNSKKKPVRDTAKFSETGIGSKGRRMNVENVEEITDSIRSSNKETFLNVFAEKIKEDDEISNIFYLLKAVTGVDERRVASHIAEAFEKAVLSCSLEYGTGAPFLNGKIAAKVVDGRAYSTFGDNMKTDVYKLPHIKFVFNAGEYKIGTGLIYNNNGISELSVGGKYDKDKELFTVTTSDSMFVKKGDVIDVTTGEKVVKKTTKTTKTTSKPTSKTASKKNIKRK